MDNKIVVIASKGVDTRRLIQHIEELLVRTGLGVNVITEEDQNEMIEVLGTSCDLSEIRLKELMKSLEPIKYEDQLLLEHDKKVKQSQLWKKSNQRHPAFRRR